jgi:hypothetical protein
VGELDAAPWSQLLTVVELASFISQTHLLYIIANGQLIFWSIYFSQTVHHKEKMVKAKLVPL